MSPNALRILLGAMMLAGTSYGSIVTYSEVIPNGVVCPTLTAAQGTCFNNASAFITSTASVLGFATTGASMAGLRVTAYFSDGFSQSLVWAGTGGNSGGVTQATGTHRWSLTEAADTFTTPFVLTNSATNTTNITDIIISGLGGTNGAGQGTIFDRTSTPDVSGTSNEQTPGSHSGHDLSITSGTSNAYSLLVTYKDIFRVTSTNVCNNGGNGSGSQRTVAPCADEFATMVIHFNVGTGVVAFTPGSTLSFMQDADNTSGLIGTPEPATLGLVGACLVIGSFVVRRRSRNRKDGDRT